MIATLDGPCSGLIVVPGRARPGAMIDRVPRTADDRSMNDQWQVLAVYPDPASAEAAAGLLRSESIHVRVAVDEPVPGLMKGCSLMVPAAMLTRAQAIFSLAPLTDEEWSQYVADAQCADDPDEMKP